MATRLFTRFRYRCPRCGTTSPRFRTRARAREAGARHRRTLHGGHHPDGEHIQLVSRARSTRSEAIAVVLIAALIVLAVLRHLTG